MLDSRLFTLLVILVALWGGPALAQEPAPPGTLEPGEAPADRIYRGGPVVTVDDTGRVAEALAVRGGHILAVGTEAEVAVHRGPATEDVDLAGHALLPGFIDAHGHVTQVGALSIAVNVASPPVGPITDIAQLQAALRERAAGTPAGTWVMGAGYDDALLAEQRHPTRADLDAVSTEHPIAIVHVSLHLIVANSAALAAARITADTPNPEGGVIRRGKDGKEPNGVLEETAMWAALGALPKPTLEEGFALLEAGIQSYVRAGFTTVQDGATRAEDWALLRAAADNDRLQVDVISYPVFLEAESILAETVPGGEYGRLKLGGIKLILDGSPQGKTAWLSEPYLVPPDGQEPGYHGYPWLQDEEAARVASDAYERGLQLIAHANGDAAAEQLFAAVEKAQAKHGSRDRRTVLIHAQVLREEQVDRIRRLGIIPSFFVSHVFFWGDWHRDSVLGPERAVRISPAASALRRGIPFTFHNDAPVTPPDALRLIAAGVNRTTRSGVVLGPQERVPVAAAVRAVTRDAAFAHFEEGMKGSLEPGKLADLVILSANPLTADLGDLAGIRVLETVKEGKSLFRAEP
ncbi:MAG: amidohydrolase [Myxococcales bacterium]|nr:amidohydrolase [Myxococcales bacterium]